MDYHQFIQHLQNKFGSSPEEAHQMVCIIFKKKGIPVPPKPPILSPEQRPSNIVEQKTKNNSTIEKVIESMLHRTFTVAADRLYGAGYMNREERIALSSAIGDMLASWREHALKKLNKAGVENPEEVMQRAVMTVLGEAPIARMAIGPPVERVAASRQAPGWGRPGEPDSEEWPFDDPELNPKVADLGGTMGGIPSLDQTKDSTKDIVVSKIGNDEDEDSDTASKNEAIALPGAAPGNEEKLAMATKDQENTRTDFGRGEQYDMKGDFDKEEDNYNMKESGKQKLQELITRKEFARFVVSEVKRTILEKTPPGKTKAGKPFERVVKAVKKSDSDVNPYAVAWSLKNKQKSEAPTLEQFKENFDSYMENELGFKKTRRDNADIWRRTGK